MQRELFEAVLARLGRLKKEGACDEILNICSHHGFFACAAISRAEMIDWYLQDDHDGAISCTYNLTENTLPEEYDMFIEGDHNRWETGHLDGWFDTEHHSYPTHPKTINVFNRLRNCTDFDWTDYHIDVFMDHLFTISNPFIEQPDDWTALVTQPVYNSGLGKWVGAVDYYAGTPVLDGIYNQTLKVGYKITFWGYTHYCYWQHLTPTPEPGTIVLLAFALIGLFIIRRRFI